MLFRSKGVSEELKQKIFGNLSTRAAENLKEEMQMLGAVKSSEVEGRQQEIVDVIRRLENAGLVVVASGEGEKMLS